MVISETEFQEIARTYERFGWVLRRLCLSTAARETLASALTGLDAHVVISESGVDAAWFARPYVSGATAWELRSLGGTPFAILEHLDEKSADFESRLAEIEERLTSADPPVKAA